jgi:transketolase
VESAVAWKAAIERDGGPTSLLFSRQSLSHQARSSEQIQSIARGGYVLRDCAGEPHAIVIATGSEVGLAVQTAAELDRRGVRIRVVSMPSTDVFDAQDDAYRESVLPRNVRARIAIEAGVSAWWRKYVGLDGAVVGIDTFGESAPAGAVFEHFGFTVSHVMGIIEEIVDRDPVASLA